MAGTAMSISGPLANLLLWAGLWLAPLIWAANMQLGQILPYADCRTQVPIAAISSFLGAGVTILAGVVSWRSAARQPAEAGSRATASAFGGRLSALSAAIFTFALLMQGIASMVLSGCEK
ncbi:hypothetical protein [Bradyrhizobium sp. USDA 4486]